MTIDLINRGCISLLSNKESSSCSSDIQAKEANFTNIHHTDQKLQVHFDMCEIHSKQSNVEIKNDIFTALNNLKIKLPDK